ERNEIEMKNLIAIFIFYISQIGFSQSIFPEIKSNATEEDKTESIIYSLLSNKYEFIIAYTTQCYWWSDKKNYVVYAFKNNTWEKIIVDSKRKKNGNWTKPKSKSHIISNQKANELIQTLSKKSFWDLKREELNIDKQKNDDGSVTKFSLHDGVNYRFEIITKQDFRIIESYEPEYFLEKMPEIKERKIFINCRDDFENFIKNGA
ncbi:hypothetical protein LZZ90_13940, partial [Flavobacterium sp. SM15]|uniref:hypothetical protein n=1 Tax=Flavobacterium sp. SM15 TaxID=2908005 RepID=UPI001EDBE0F5